MNKKMGADAWGAAEIGSAAPMGANAMGGGSGALFLIKKTIIIARGGGGSPEATLYYGDYKPFGYPELHVKYDDEVYVLARNDTNSGAWFGATDPDKDSIYDFSEYPFGFNNGVDVNGKAQLSIRCKDAGPHSIEIWFDGSQYYKFDVYQPLVKVPHNQPFVVEPEQTAAPTYAASIIYNSSESFCEEPTPMTGGAMRYTINPTHSVQFMTDQQGQVSGLFAPPEEAEGYFALYQFFYIGEE